MKMVSRLTVAAVFLLGVGEISLAKKNCADAQKTTAVCSKDIVKQKVVEACEVLKKEGKAGLQSLKKMRYDCCGEPNYVWVNDTNDKPKMVMHPIKPQLNGKDLSNSKDPDGKKLFVEFVKAVKAKPDGEWVDYKWTKFGEEDPTKKISWVVSCTPKGESNAWVVGSGTWVAN